MNISMEKLLTKIEEELTLAKNSTKVENLREKVYSIKILCELILDEQQDKRTVPVAPVIHPQQSLSLNQPKKIDLGNEANGDSLLDF